MKVVILTEGGMAKGFGHIARCYSLCQAFERYGVLPELIVNSNDNIGRAIGYDNCRPVNWLDTKAFSDCLARANVAIIDSYLADVAHFQLASETVATCVYIDDNNRIPYPAGIVVNGTAFADMIGFPEREGVEYLLGTKYMPLRSVFWEASDKQIRSAVETIMVTFGGDDAMDMTPRVLAFLAEKYSQKTKVVVVGKSFRTIEQIKALKDDRTELVDHPDAGGMKQIMLKSDLAVSAAGQTTYELARVGVPTIAVGTYRNQMDNVRGWLKAGFIEYAGWCEDANLIEKMEEAVEKFQDVQIRKARSAIGRRCIDGRGSTRIVRYIMDKCCNERSVPRK